MEEFITPMMKFGASIVCFFRERARTKCKDLRIGNSPLEGWQSKTDGVDPLPHFIHFSQSEGWSNLFERSKRNTSSEACPY
jgi:hypothetical protein